MTSSTGQPSARLDLPPSPAAHRRLEEPRRLDSPSPEAHRPLDLFAFGAIVALAAALRFIALPTRGTWDADQGHDMLVLRGFVEGGVWPLLGPPTSIGEFHHGALYYYLLAPAAWLSGSDPVAVVGEIALLGILAVALVWWIARSVAGSGAGSGAGSIAESRAGSIVGPIAGGVAALVMAVSASAIDESTFIWNPNLIAFSSALAVAAAWRAWTTRHVRWWLLAALALAITMQSHVLGVAFAVPLVAWLTADVRRRAGRERRGAILVGAGSAGLIILTYGPLFVYELGHDFAETRAALAFLAGGGQGVALDPISRLVFVGLRVLSWPLGGLLTQALAIGVVASVSVVAILLWRLRVADATERPFVRWLALALAWCWLVLGLGVAGLATVTPLPVDHYHAFLDPLVFVIVGFGIAGLWRRFGDVVWGRALLVIAVAVLVAWNVTIWPPAVAADGGWPAARAAAERISTSAGPGPITLISLPEFKSPEAYDFPLARAGREVVMPGIVASGAARSGAARSGAGASGAAWSGAVAPSGAGPVVVVCDSLFVDDCGGPAEERALVTLESAALESAALESAALESSAAPGSRVDLRLVDRFVAAPGRTLSIYRR